tara:strand:+ start:449 stop:802 length:354 start_codon:yes stop_codon:yes gene_type:complete
VSTFSKLSKALPHNLEEANRPSDRWRGKKRSAALAASKPLSIPKPRKPRFPARLADAAEKAARIIAREVLVNPDKEGIDDLIGLAMWLESLSTWRKYKTKEEKQREADWYTQQRDNK